MIRFFKLLSIIAFLLALQSCGGSRLIFNQDRLERVKTALLIQKMDSLSQAKPHYFYAKIATSYSDTNRNLNFKTSLRIVRDSAINALITYAAIPIANSLVTKDSIVLMNKREKCYSKQSLEYFKNNFGVDFTFSNLEEILLGMPFDYDTTQKYFQIHGQDQYTLSTHRKRQAKRFDRFVRVRQKEDVLIKYYIDTNLRDLKGMYIESPSDSASVSINYISRQLVDGYNFPNEVEITVVLPKNRMVITLDYDKVDSIEVQQLELIIPESYEECE
ncbi:MAG: DUF4292 domain-containing protein [Crocinitomicaceae bacterium]|nr:DUF4292 domain-containing protein [Crocinitomicaceae bacterium]